MQLTDRFIHRPVLATVVNVFLLVAGLVAIRQLNVRQYPETRDAEITVTTVYPGASADLVRGFITTPLEREIASADGIDYLESASGPSVSIIRARLRLNYDSNAALTQITSKVNRVRNELPAGAEDPVFDVSIGATTAAMYLNFSSDTMDTTQISDFLLRVVQPKIATVPGVQSAEILGGRTFAVRIWLKPDRMAALGLSPADVRDIIGRQSTLAAVGKTKGAMIMVNLTANTDLRDPSKFGDIIVRRHDGETVRLRDIADVTLGAEDYDSALKFNGKATTFIGITVLPTANSLDVVRNVRALFPELRGLLPGGMTMTVPYDSTEFIRESITEVIKTLVEATLIVIIVVYLFLGTVRSVLVPVVAIPLSLVGACVLMIAMGFTINLLTLLAMVLAIGLVVDDAIVVVENIHRHIEEGHTPFDAAVAGARELVSAVIAMTITLAAVYAPIGFQTGLTGSLFREFAFTLAGAVLISGFVALTLSPMLSSRLLPPTESPRGLAGILDRGFDLLRGAYEHLLDKALNARSALYLFAGFVLVALVLFVRGSRSELAPAEDRGFVIGIAFAAPDASLEHAVRYTDQVYESIRKLPETQAMFSAIGFDPSGGPPTPSAGFIGWVLKPWSQRQRSTLQMLGVFQGIASGIAGANIVGFQPPALPGAPAGMPVQFIVGSTEDHSRVLDASNALLGRALGSGLFVYGDNNLKFDQPEGDITIDREKAAALGVDMQRLSADLGSMLGGGYVSRFSMDGRAYKVTPQVSRAYRLNVSQLDNYYVATGRGTLIPLSTFARIEPTVQPRSLRRFQQLNAATLSLLPAPGVTMGQVLTWLNRAADETLPQGYSKDYGGELRQYVQESGSLLTTFLLALLVIYLVLSALYESFRDPLIIMVSVPLSLAGAMSFIYLGAATLNIYTEVGLITLVGLITKHGILIVEFANQLRAQKGYTARQAVEHAAGVRLRPILMTTAAMVLGVLPLVFAKGAGAEARYSIGLVIAAGMSIGTLFTLFIVPAFYLLIAARDRPPIPPAAA
ncbi:efflux pump membrane transporter BepE [mine drainage metagenome]|uniref:Efflux pump membrane transporter BepE n=1 Tax=mine drainage metagenome TaxID=410659 RepID=A0A1J5SJ37_9ZZZZ